MVMYWYLVGWNLEGSDTEYKLLLLEYSREPREKQWAIPEEDHTLVLQEKECVMYLVLLLRD